jgi:hypothetical protein
LKLLQEFPVPPVPAALNNILTQKILGIGLVPGTVGIQGGPKSTSGGAGSSGSSGGSTSLGGSSPAHGSGVDWGKVCGTILLVVSIIGILCTGYAQNASNYPGKGSGELTAGTPVGESVTLRQLEEISQTPDGLSTINSVYGTQLTAWQALAASRLALVLRGLLYPDPSDLGDPTFSQFLAIPRLPGFEAWYPSLPMPSPDDGTSWPTSGLEAPATLSSPYGSPSSPAAFLTDPTVDSVYSLSPNQWVRMAEEIPGFTPLVNYNLDADRGYPATCWKLAPGASITDPPVLTVTLNYNEI